jgi:hypothetical protein
VSQSPFAENMGSAAGIFGVAQFTAF